MAVISFARGVPSADLLPVEAITQASARVLQRDPAAILSYGPAGGYPPLRALLAERHGVEPERILVSTGSLQGVAFAAEHLARSENPSITVEAPTYDRSLQNFTSRRLEVRAVALTAQGLDVEALAAQPPPAMLYTIPTFQNPAGSTLPQDQRKQVTEWAAEHGVMVYEDDPYQLLRYDGAPVPTMHSLAPERVLWSTSFTKTVAPGLRVGYSVVPPDLVDGLTQLATQTYISPSFLPQAIVADLLVTGAFETAVAASRTALAARLEALCAGLDQQIPEASYVRPEGGYFLWLRLPDGLTAAAVAAACPAHEVTLVPGTDFFLRGGDDHVRLAFSAVAPGQITEGVRRLAAAMAAARVG